VVGRRDGLSLHKATLYLSPG